MLIYCSLVRETIDRALSIDPSYAPAYARLALLEAVQLNDLPSAARHVERGLELDPANLDVISVAVRVGRLMGRLKQAIGLAEYAVMRDPVNVVTREGLASAYALSNRFDEAIAQLRTALQFNPGSVHVHEHLGEVFLLKHDPEAALSGAVTSPQLSTLHSDPRWSPLLRKLGLAPEQLAAIKFDAKVPQ